MPTYISLVSFTDQGMRNIKDSPKRLNAIRKALKKLGGEMKAAYLTVGSYDSVVICDAPNDEVAAKLLLGIGSAGNVRTITMRAFPYTEARKIIGEIPQLDQSNA
jgi:uncharacterized protein with GYD domain